MTDRPNNDSGSELDAVLAHRPPFRLIDAVEECGEERVVCRVAPRGGDPFWSMVYAGHYPGSPVTPGVLLCEMAFQAGAVLMNRRLSDAENSGDNGGGRVPVVARILSAKFRRMVPPEAELRVTVDFVERMAEAFVLKAKVASAEGEALRVEFVVAMAPAP